MRNLSLPALLLFHFMVFCPQAEFAQSATAAVPPTEISAEQGTCSALITVTGADSKAVYNAKVTTRVHYGFMGIKKLDLETFTSAAGQVKIVGLPEVPKKPVLIFISKDGKFQSVEFKPEVHCQATLDVQLK
jgi:hypothetical protein